MCTACALLVHSALHAVGECRRCTYRGGDVRVFQHINALKRQLDAGEVLRMLVGLVVENGR